MVLLTNKYVSKGALKKNWKILETRVKTLKNLRNNLSSEKTGDLRNNPLLEETNHFLYSDTECSSKNHCS